MSQVNLRDAISGIRKYHKDSPHLEALEKELTSRQQARQWEYVDHLPNETAKYEYKESGWSSHALVKVLQQGSPSWNYHLWDTLGRIVHRGRYVLHS